MILPIHEQDLVDMSSAAKISITMTPDMLREVRGAVRSGEFASTSEALRDAIRVWQRQRMEDAERLATIQGRLRRSLTDSRSNFDEDAVERRLDELHHRTLQAHRGATT